MEENNLNIDNNEITLKELIQKIQKFFWEVIKNWLFVVLVTISIIVYVVYRTYQKPTTYPATLTFMINEDDGGMSSFGGLAASLGIGGRKGEYNLEKIFSLLKSRHIIQRGLFAKHTFNGKEDYFANHFINLYRFHDKWKESEINELISFKFSSDDVINFNRTENLVLKELYSEIIGSSENDGILEKTINEDTGIMTLIINSVNEDFSIAFVKVLFTNLKQFYTDKTIEKQKATYEIMKYKVDSLRTNLNNVQYRLLKIQDTQRNLTLKQFEAEELRLRREAQVMIAAYGEAVKHQEAADFALKSKTPFIQTIDTPIPPIPPSKNLMSYIKDIILAGFLGSLLAIMYIIVRKIIRDAING